MSKEYLRLYASVLKLKFMGEEFKVSCKTNRRTILLLKMVVDWGLQNEEVKKMMPADGAVELTAFAEDLLSKSELSEEFLESVREPGNGKVV